MNRVRFAAAATLITAGVCGGAALLAQAAQAPPMQSVLAGKKLTPPLRGEAQVEFTVSTPKREKREGKEMIVTRFMVKNVSSAPVARLTIAETWYDKGGAVIAGGKGVINGLLQPGEVQPLTIETPWTLGMLSNNYNFTHVNGTVKPKKVAKLDAPAATAGGKEPAATPAAATKK